RIIREVTASNLVGRGGAAFPTGRKWDAVAKAAARPHYVVCNADESEPGTFKDRVLMEGDPFAVIEGMSIAAYATASERGYFYIRGEYPLAARRVDTAIRAARSAGFLGNDILGSGFSFDIEVRRGGGAAGTFIGPDKLDVPLTFEGTRAIGAALGSAVVMIFDETVDMADILTRVAAFFRDESCGQCVPCRIGTVRQQELLGRLRSGRTIGTKAD